MSIILSRALCFPIGNGEILYTGGENATTTEIFQSYFDNPVLYNEDCQTEEFIPGCEWAWCEHQPQLNIVQFLIGFEAVFIGTAICQAIIMALYSKVLGPRPQVQ